MSALATPAPLPSGVGLHAAFLAILPRIELHGQIYFRHVRCPDRKEEVLAELRGLAWMWYVRLHQRGKDPATFVSAIAVYAARAVHSGRRVCGKERAKDVLSPVAQRQYGFTVESLPHSTTTSHDRLYASPFGQEQLDVFEERLHDNTLTPVPDQVAFRIDFPAWLQTLTGRERALIRLMARNERTKDLSKQFELSPGRISQMRREFRDGWLRFHGELTSCHNKAAVR